MAKTDECPSREILRDYLSGQSDASQMDAVDSHVATCATCEETLESLEGEEDTMIRQLRSATASSSNSVSLAPEVRRALEVSGQAASGSRNESANTVRPTWLPPNNEIGPYRLLRPIGSGGMGVVYLATHRDLGKNFAIKLLPISFSDGERRLDRFLREIRAAGSLDHSTIVHATDAGSYDGIHFLAMEYIDGLDLGRIARVQSFDISDACQVIRQVALGLNHAHSQGVVHRDIKPSNLMIGRGGEVKILDFGLAQVSAWDGEYAELTTVGQLMGTLDYMSPEQAEQPGAVDYRADLYSLGATLFRLLAGRPPLAAAPDLSPLAKLRLLANHHAPRIDTLRSDVPAELAELTSSLLAASPSDRPASAAHVAEALEAFTKDSDLTKLVADAINKLPPDDPSEPPTRTLRPEPAPADGKPPSRSRWWIAAAMLPFALFFAVTIVLKRNEGQLVIESEVDDISVKLVQDGSTAETLRVETGATSTRLLSGSYQLQLKAGSDRVEIDKGVIEIRRGQTTIARIRQKPNGNLKPSRAVTRPSGNDAAKRDENATTRMTNIPGVVATTLPSSDRPLQPGQRLDLKSLASKGLDMELTVMGDHTIKPSLLGIVSVRGKTLAEVEAELNEKYQQWYSDPAVELFLQFDSVSGTPIGLPGPPHIPTGSPAVVSGNVEARKLPVYQGRNLSEWLTIVETEREQERIHEAMEAVISLASVENRESVIRVLKENFGRLSKGRIGRALGKVIEPGTHSEFVIAQLESEDPKWAAEILDCCMIFVEDAETVEDLARWTLDHGMVRGADPAIVKETRDFLIAIAFEPRYDRELRMKTLDRIREVSLGKEPLISPFYWFTHWQWQSEDGFIENLLFDRCKQTILDEGSTPHELSAALATMRIKQAQHFDFGYRLGRDEEIAAAVIKRVGETERSKWSNEFPPSGEASFTGFEVPGFSVPEAGFKGQVFVNSDGTCRHSDPIVELLRLARALGTGKKMRPQLEALLDETKAGYQTIIDLFAKSTLKTVALDWESMTPRQIRWDRAGAQSDRLTSDALPKPQDWFDAFIHGQVFALLNSQ